MITTIVFDIGETVVDETRAWTAMADAAGVTPLTLFAALTVARIESLTELPALLATL